MVPYVASPHRKRRRLGISLDLDAAYEGRDGAGATHVVPFRVDEMTLGNVRAEGLDGAYVPTGTMEDTLQRGGFLVPEVLTREFPAAGLVSHQFFRPYRLTFDFDGMRIFLTRPA